jgi:molybdate transport system regulatory protein
MKTVKKGKRTPTVESGTIAPRIKLWFEADGRRVFCAGICQILQAVEQTGSIKEAAATMGRSYRFVWGRLKEAEATFGLPLVESRVGGELAHRTTLTPSGRHLAENFQRLRQKLFAVADAEFAKLFGETFACSTLQSTAELSQEAAAQRP